MAYAGTTTLNDMTTETSGYAVTSSGSAKVVVNRGTHTHSNTNQDRANFWIFNGGHMTLNDVNAISEEAVILNSTGTVDVNGGDFKTTGTKSCFVNNSANLTIDKGSTTAVSYTHLHIPVWLLRPAVWISLTVAVLDQIGSAVLVQQYLSLIHILHRADGR